MNELLRELLDALDVIGDDNEEIYDTECRDRMGEAIFRMFIKPEPGYVLPADFGLHSRAANRKVQSAIERYCRSANESAEI